MINDAAAKEPGCLLPLLGRICQGGAVKEELSGRSCQGGALREELSGRSGQGVNVKEELSGRSCQGGTVRESCQGEAVREKLSRTVGTVREYTTSIDQG